MLLKAGENLVHLSQVTLNVVVEGNGPLLFATTSGWGPGYKYLSYAFSRLSKDLTIAVIATRGSGGSSRPADPTRMSSDDMADDIEELRQHLGLPFIDLFGHSNGGSIAISFAARYPNSCRRLILCDSWLLGFDDSPFTADVIDRFKNDPQARYSEALAQWPRKMDLSSDEAFTACLLSFLPLYFAHPELYCQEFIASQGRNINVWCAKHQWAGDKAKDNKHVDILGDITAKTMIMVGRDDFICPVPTSQRIHQGINGSILKVVEGSGHMPWVDQRAEFDKIISDFYRAPPLEA